MATQFGKYQLLKKIASGGMAEIHLAKQRGMEGFEKIVIIKMILPHLTGNQEFVQMFLDEARLAAKLTHPNIVQIFDLGRAAGTYFIAMEYIQGENLRAISKACRKQKQVIPLQHTVKAISQACEGLYHAHAKTDTMGNPLNVVHRDISPQNIMVSFEGLTKVVDFGIAKAATQYQETRSGVLKGKYAYMSPEQCTGRPVDARSDLFALGIVLWELATGTRLFKKSSELMILKEITEGVVTPPRQVNQQIPAELEAIILKALEKDPDKRFQDSLQMHLALEEFLKNQGLTSSTVHLAAFMREVFKDKLDSLRKIEQAQQSGDNLESLLFDDVDLGSGYDTGTGVNTPSQPSQAGSPVSTPSQPLYPKPTTGVSRVTGQPGASQTGTGLTGQQAATGMATQASQMGAYPEPPKKRNTLMLLVVLLLLLALGGVGFLIWQMTQQQPGGTEPPPADAGVTVPPSSATAHIAVDSAPAGGTVRIDGTDRCTAPCEVEDLKVGVFYNLEVVKPGYEPWSAGFKLDEPDSTRSFSARLVKATAAGWGRVRVETQPDGASLVLDGAAVNDKSPTILKRVAAGKRHTLRASLPGHRDWVETFKLKPGQSLRLEGRLPRSGGSAPPRRRVATYRLRSRPPGASFFLDGKPVKSRTLKLDPDNSYRLSAKLAGHKSWSEKLEPSPGERRRIVARLPASGGAPPPRRDGKLFLDASPWAHVYIDGEKVGTTPVTNHSLAPGAHQIRLTNPELGLSKNLKIEVSSGQVVRKKVAFSVAKGKLLVRARPWADVYLNGKKIGTTPLPPRALPPGDYVVRLHNPTLDQETDKRVKIEPGKTARVTVNFLE